jgi:hypothetical protein
MTKEEQEHALFKNIFQTKIKSMTCIRQFKYYLLVVSTAVIVSAYFTASYFMVTNIFKNS